MKKLPIGRQTFSDLIEEDLLYVDKTKWIWEIVRQGKFYFLSRPRRFGKSLLLSTLKSFFEGREDLFRGLYIHDQVKEWKTHPVIHIDYSFVDYRTDLATFKTSLLNYLKSLGQAYGIFIEETIIQNYFRELIIALEKKHGKVVILVDEYDKPLVDMLTDEVRFNENREVLHGLYSSMKGLDPYLRMVFLTGVSRFAKVSIFSGMNNPDDLSLDKKYSALVGFTQKELEQHFAEYLEKLGQEFSMSSDSLMDHISFWYNGFSWDGETRLYNPFSVLNLFQKENFNNYWFSTGTPTFLINLIKGQKYLPESLENIKTNDLIGGSVNIHNIPLVPLLFQTGYLTIAKIVRDGVRNRYYLNYPNEEVRHSFLTYIAASFVEKDEFEIQPEILNLRDALLEENTEQFIRLLQSFFAGIPSRLHLPREAYYHSLVYLLLRLIGLKLTLERETDKGRIDGVLELEDKVYIIEFKFATNKRIKNVKTLSAKALKQIQDKKYYDPWIGSGKKIILFGIGFLDKAIDGRVKVLA